MILFWISGFLLPFRGGMVAGLIFSTEQAAAKNYFRFSP